MESAVESRLSSRVDEGFTWHETHFYIGKREAVYLRSPARVNNTFEVDDFVSTRLESPGPFFALESSQKDQQKCVASDIA